MPIYTIQTPDGRKLKIEAANEQAAINGARQWSQQNAQPATPGKPRGYDAARRRLERQTAATRESQRRISGPLAGFMQGSSDFQSQIARNLGVMDEVAGGMSAGVQGIENIARRMAGKPIDIPMQAAYRAAADIELEEKERFAKERPGLNMAANVLGVGLSGVPKLAAAVPAVANPIRAGLTAAGLNVPFAIGRQEGSLVERLPGAALETVATAGLGTGIAAAGNALGRSATAMRARPPTAARRLSQEGVELTPGQMLGGAAQRVEDGLTSVPVVGDAIRGAKIRGLETFDRAAINRSLAPIGQALPDNVNVGREGVGFAQKAVSDAYDAALSGVQIVPDQPFVSALQSARANAGQGQAANEVAGVLDDILARLSQGPVDGNTFKMIDADVGAAARAMRNAATTTPSMGRGAQVLDDVAVALDDLLGRVNPQALAGKQAADEAFANLWRVNKAASGVGAREGVFSAPQLSSAVRAGDTGRKAAFGRGEALMQDLSDAGTEVLPSTVPDSGTPFRSLLTLGGAGLGGAGLGIVDPTAVIAVGGGVAAGSALYSPQVVSLLNRIYRTSDPALRRQLLARLAVLTAENPALGVAVNEALSSGERPMPVLAGQ